MEVNLVFVAKNGTTQTFPLPSAVTFLGRRQDCDMCIPLPVVSRRHCEIYTEFGKLHVRDLKSNNGTYVNEESIEEIQLNAGDILRVGPVKFVIQIDGIPDNFDKFLTHTEQGTAPPAATASHDDETQEAELEEIIPEDQISTNSGQSQTMDIDSIFNNGLSDDDNFDLGSDLLNS